MRSSWGNVRTPKNSVHTTWGFLRHTKVVTDKGGCFTYGYKRKKYTRTHPYPQNTMRINPVPREKAAIVMLRKHGYTINQLAKAWGRSTSYIYRCLRFNILIKNLRPVDMRKLPSETRLYHSRKRCEMLMRYMPAWEAWALGEGDKPP